MNVLSPAILGLLLASAALSLGAAGPAPCQQAEPHRAAVYVRECLRVSPATHPPCNAHNPCAVITAEIRRGCALLGEGIRPRFCAARMRETSPPHDPLPQGEGGL